MQIQPQFNHGHQRIQSPGIIQNQNQNQKVPSIKSTNIKRSQGPLKEEILLSRNKTPVLIIDRLIRIINLLRPKPKPIIKQIPLLPITHFSKCDPILVIRPDSPMSTSNLQPILPAQQSRLCRVEAVCAADVFAQEGACPGIEPHLFPPGVAELRVAVEVE